MQNKILKGDKNQELSAQTIEKARKPSHSVDAGPPPAALARSIADYLFRDVGDGRSVTRLVLSREGEDNGRSGWSKQVVIDHIETVLGSGPSYQRRLYEEC